ncbi:HdeD family acid-resistance protein [Tropicimonas sp. IMCC34043]|uniref:HdeD family acid-resistance protein n=1 Tax=Tropicimonas sp. IMCC34043 TaxID=2248760 RepID=UPI001300428B|nr:DUF308 domain-containing protein [Tropicimonas sp. IMCC34043]
MGNRILWLLLAVLFIAGGMFALMNPFAASLAATVIAGWVFIFSGVVEVFAGFRAKGAGAKIWTVLLGLLAIVLGIMILGNPLGGMVALTTIIAIMFLAGGVAKIIMSFTMEDRRFLWLFLISGAASAVLGFIILTNFPLSAATSLGLLLGIELLFDGAAALGMAFSRDHEEAVMA